MVTPRRRVLGSRLVARHVSELTLARLHRWRALVSQERLSIFVFDIVLSASIANHPYRDPVSGQWIGLEDARAVGRPVTAAAVAQSMGLPYTTVRRQAAELSDAGLLARGVEGFHISERLFADGSVARFAAADAEDLLRILKTLAEADYAPASAALDAGCAKLPAGVVGRLVVDFALRAMETFTELYGDFASGTIVASIIAANVRYITDDPELAQLYAGEDAPPPDSLRRPIALRVLARDLGKPFETVRRRVAELVSEGRVQWKDDGVIVPTSVLLSDKHLDNNRRIVAHFDQMLATLQSLASDARC